MDHFWTTFKKRVENQIQTQIVQNHSLDEMTKINFFWRYRGLFRDKYLKCVFGEENWNDIQNAEKNEDIVSCVDLLIEKLKDNEHYFDYAICQRCESYRPIIAPDIFYGLCEICCREKYPQLFKPTGSEEVESDINSDVESDIGSDIDSDIDSVLQEHSNLVIDDNNYKLLLNVNNNLKETVGKYFTVKENTAKRKKIFTHRSVSQPIMSLEVYMLKGNGFKRHIDNDVDSVVDKNVESNVESNVEYESDCDSEYSDIESKTENETTEKPKKRKREVIISEFIDDFDNNDKFDGIMCEFEKECHPLVRSYWENIDHAAEIEKAKKFALGKLKSYKGKENEHYNCLFTKSRSKATCNKEPSESAKRIHLRLCPAHHFHLQRRPIELYMKTLFKPLSEKLTTLSRSYSKKFNLTKEQKSDFREAVRNQISLLKIRFKKQISTDDEKTVLD
jgi:hypothetical protein